MKLKFVSMKKYKMMRGYTLLHLITHFITIQKYWSGQIIQFRILYTWGFDIDLRKGSLVDQLLNDSEKLVFYSKIK